jgi:hypothetical protein
VKVCSEATEETEEGTDSRNEATKTTKMNEGFWFFGFPPFYFVAFVASFMRSVASDPLPLIRCL